MAKKELRAIKFAQSIETEAPSNSIKVDEISVEADYSGPKLDSVDDINADWVENLMEHFRDQKPLHKKYAIMIMLRAKEIFQSHATLVDVPIDDDKEFTVCGDVHGQYYDFVNIFKLNGSPSPNNPYLFNGDFVDRGSFSVEVILTLFAWKCCYPDSLFMTRGNHETRNLNKFYGFEGEVVKKFNGQVYDLFCEIFCTIPLATCLNKKVLCVHGGLFSKDGVTLEDIRNTNRFREPPDEGIMSEVLWSDPTKENGIHPSKRGMGVAFGPDIAKKFLDNNNLELLVRSHEVKPEGYEVEADGRVITVFSAPNYCDQMGNKGAYIRFKGSDMKPQFNSFPHVLHPNIPAMFYAKPYSLF
mmetsp:Transcript_14455/g.15961  ORF Transcript_14455/g.15961 Transcript_14455/m.15961 type:complete len:357 (+) Transcript_14455:1-1071(+)